MAHTPRADAPARTAAAAQTRSARTASPADGAAGPDPLADAPVAPAAPPEPHASATRPGRKLSAQAAQAREQRAARTREQLLVSTALVVGAHGYREASVQRITSHAGLAQGTFYLYFDSRQALFDVLLPHFGLQMLDHVRDRAAGVRGFFAVEEVGVRAVFEYLSDHPWFWRVLNEAEVEAPVAWTRHHEEVIRRYMKFLRRARADGELADYAEDELDTVAQLLVAARDYLYRCKLIHQQPGSAIPDSVMRTYRRFIEHGLGRPA